MSDDYQTTCDGVTHDLGAIDADGAIRAANDSHIKRGCQLTVLAQQVAALLYAAQRLAAGYKQPSDPMAELGRESMVERLHFMRAAERAIIQTAYPDCAAQAVKAATGYAAGIVRAHLSGMQSRTVVDEAATSACEIFADAYIVELSRAWQRVDLGGAK